jgi:hypothetical protein
LGAAGIYTAAASILCGLHRPLFARVAAAFILPFSALFLLNIVISHALFKHVDTTLYSSRAPTPNVASSSASPLTGSPSSSSRLSHRVGERGRGRHAGRASQRQARRGFHGGSMAGQGGAAQMVAPLLGNGRGWIY